MGTFLGVPIIRTIVYLGLYWGPLILGNYHLGLQRAHSKPQQRPCHFKFPYPEQGSNLGRARADCAFVKQTCLRVQDVKVIWEERKNAVVLHS